MSALISDRSEKLSAIDRPLLDDSLTEDDWFSEETMIAHRPTVVPPTSHLASAPSAPVETTLVDSGRSRILAGLLRMADAYRASGSLHQALEMYFSLMRDHEGTTQADAALDRILDVASRYEQSGELRQARSIYEQLL